MFVHVTVFLLLWGRTRADVPGYHCFEESDIVECDNGCQLGYYGDLCDRKCPSKCDVYRGGQPACSQDSGYCLNGCISGWYGDICDGKCPENCEDDVCDRYSGDCTRGCKSGFYGIECKDRCSPNCREKKCNRDGSCGCKHGFARMTCEVECSTNCLDQVCHLNDDIRVCSKGCVPGFTGLYCQDLCPDACTDCHQNGSCVTDSRPKREAGSSRCLKYNYITNQCECCISNWTGANCSVSCENCKQSFADKKCRKMCYNKTYGEFCDKPCPDKCAKVCNKMTGACIACTRGYYGDVCKDECDRRCNTSGCIKETGHCINCTNRYGLHCQKECSDGCDEVCNHSTGNCKCKGGWIGSRCSCKIGTGCPSKEAVEANNGDHCCIGPCMLGYAGEACRGHCLRCPNGCHKMNGTCYLQYPSEVHANSAILTVAAGIMVLFLAVVIGELGILVYVHLNPKGQCVNAED